MHRGMSRGLHLRGQADRCTSTRTSASTAVPASRSARSRPSTTRTTSRSSGPSTTRRTSSSSTTSARRAVPRRWVRSTRTTRSSPPCRCACTASDARPMGLLTARPAGLPLGHADAVRRAARAYPGGIVDLSVGTPVDPTPEVVREALAAAADSPGYPTTHGTPELRRGRRRLVRPSARRPGPRPGGGAADGRLQGAGRVPARRCWASARATSVAAPAAAYPTYDVGARLAGATPEPTDDRRPALGPPGRAARLAELARQPGRLGAAGRRAARGRRRGAVVGAARGRGLRRVLRRAGLGRAVGVDRGAEHPRPAGHRRRPRRAARGLLAVQAVEPRGLPRGVRRGRPRAGRPSCSRSASTPG